MRKRCPVAFSHYVRVVSISVSGKSSKIRCPVSGGKKGRIFYFETVQGWRKCSQKIQLTATYRECLQRRSEAELRATTSLAPGFDEGRPGDESSRKDARVKTIFFQIIRRNVLEQKLHIFSAAN